MKIGIDTLEIERINDDEKFLQKILTKNEIDYINNFKNKKERIAGFFCAKEAVFKALDMENLIHQEIEIRHKHNGRPYVQLSGKTKEMFEKKYREIDISISHSKTISTAVCIVN
ncbi:MAG: holo-ACP synthase [Christensenellales bacterium]